MEKKKQSYRVGGTKDTGVVISDVEGDDLNNTKQGNQFVWVPVNQNQKLTLEVTSKEALTGITLICKRIRRRGQKRSKSSIQTGIYR